MPDPTPEQLEKVKKLCADYGYEFNRIEDGKIFVRGAVTPLSADDLIKKIYEHCEIEFSVGPPRPMFEPSVLASDIVRPTDDLFSRRRGRQRHGKRPKFH